MPRRRANAAAPSSTAAKLRPHARSAASLLKALANEPRLMILCHLTEGELSVGDLNERLRLSQSALSQLLAVLREQGIVDTRREAQVIRYSLQPGAAAQVVNLLHDLYCGAGGR